MYICRVNKQVQLYKKEIYVVVCHKEMFQEESSNKHDYACLVSLSE